MYNTYQFKERQGGVYCYLWNNNFRLLDLGV